jgi:hypothetical protein
VSPTSIEYRSQVDYGYNGKQYGYLDFNSSVGSIGAAMRNSWHNFFRRMVTTCLVGGATAWSSAMCHAQLAFDSASDAVYNDGWQAGDDGGTNFTAWNFDGTYISAIQQRIDDGLGSGALGSSTYNDIGRAWSMFNPVEQGGGPGSQRDIARAGRGFAPLQVGQTLKVVIDNPSEQRFFRGYFVRLTGGTGGVNGNICYNGSACTPGAAPKEKMLFQMFEYFTYGQWGIAEGDGPDLGTDPDFIFTGLFDTDTVDPPQVGTDSGVRFEVKLTGAETFEAKMIPLDNVGATFTHTGTLRNPGFSIDWIEFPFFNTQSEQGFDTDFFIRSIEITAAAPQPVPGDYNNDSTVNAADYTVWRNGGPLLNEVAGVTPGQTTPEDYDAWRVRFGNTSGAGAGSALVAAVPEPSTFVYFFAASAGLMSVAFRRYLPT